jgi:hypothetical protein
MNLGPVQFSSPPTDVQEPAQPVRSPQPSQANTGTQTVRAAPKVQTQAAAAAPVGQDVVKLQYDPAVHVRIYQFVNQSGNLILQVPSEQVLNVTRGIQESFQKESVQRETLQEESTQHLTPLSEGEKNNGG